MDLGANGSYNGLAVLSYGDKITKYILSYS